MKKLIISVTILLTLFAFGCQENSITDPIQDTGLQKTDDLLVHRGTITLEQALTDPYPVFNSYYVINGEIEYQYTSKIIEPVPAQNLISLRLSVNADFTYWCTVCGPDPIENNIAGTISNDTEDIITVSEGSKYLLQKRYLIEGREDGMVLMCRFNLTMDGIELKEMWLEVGDYDPEIIDPT